MEDRRVSRDAKRGPNRRDLLRAGSLLLAPVSAVASGAGRETADVQGGSGAPDIVLENADFRLVIGGDGVARSLVEKSSGQECLAPGTNTPVFSMTQEKPLANQLILLYPAGPKTFNANAVRREGDRLLVSFEGVPYELAIRLKIANGYIAFTVDQARAQGKGWEAPGIEDLVFLQLPVRERTNFGQWLNVAWDGEVAVNLLGADPWCRIDSQPRNGYRLLRAGAEDRVRTSGVTAALIATRTDRLFDRIAEIEEAYNLPRGVESRRRKEYKYSYYWATEITPATIDRHIEYARTAGFPMMVISYRDFATSAGHFPWRPEYARGLADLRTIVAKIKSAGLLPGLHIHYSKADKSDPYVSGNPDHRLQMARVFTLAAPIDPAATAIPVVENPAGATLDDERRLLKIGNELITYESYTTSPPYQFAGCRRAQLETRAAAYEAGVMFGVLDVDTWPIFIRFNQNTTIQREVASRVAELYGAGFEFLYYDGAEDVHSPFWFTTAWAQWVVHEALKPNAHLFAEGAHRAHFNWHIMTRSNAYDIQGPELVKAKLRIFQETQAPRTAQDFTAVNFGWFGYRPPAPHTMGTQPDHVEYVASRAAGWNCPFSLDAQLTRLNVHPRTPDNLEVMRRWQEAATRQWLTKSQRETLRTSGREYTLLIDEAGAFELLPYDQIQGAGGGDRPLRAFCFERQGRTWVVYWHTEGQAALHLSLSTPRRSEVRLWEELGKKSIPVKQDAAGLVLPVGGRKYLDCAGIPRAEIVDAFQRSQVR